MQPEFFHDPVEGLLLTQNKHIDSAFKDLKKKFYPENIIEIGTCKGGFAVFLKKMFPKANVYTFDPLEWGDNEYKALKTKVFEEHNIKFWNEDCFLRDGHKIKTLLKKKTLLLCDGAHKQNEFTYFSPFLESGSIIMCHDYGRNEKYFREKIQGTYWTPAFEFDGSKFDQWCIDHKLEPILQSKFEKAVWYIRKKI